MFEILKSGGLVMIPLVLASIVMVGIILERFWTLRRSAVIPPKLGAAPATRVTTTSFPFPPSYRILNREPPATNSAPLGKPAKVPFTGPPEVISTIRKL